MRSLPVLALTVLCCGGPTSAAEKPPVYVWFEPEWFEGVTGSFGYWSGPAQPTGAWGVAGPGISPEWTQGGESEWNSMGAAAGETSATCQRSFVVPRAGRHKVWVRYFDHRHATEPFRVTIAQEGQPGLTGELGVEPVVSPGDEYALYWGFAFGWGFVEGDLAAGPARLTLAIDRPGEAWRQLDAVLITDDLDYVPYGREKPPFAYVAAFDGQGQASASPLRGSAAGLTVGRNWKRPPVGGRDFSMWTGIERGDLAFWTPESIGSLALYDVFFHSSPPYDIREQFQKQFAGRRDLPIMSWPNLLPGLYLGTTPDLSPNSPQRQWLERTGTPFYILTNYAGPQYTDESGPATYQALTGPLAGQFLGYIHGEALGTSGLSLPPAPLGADRRQHIDGLARHLLAGQAKAWSDIYRTTVPEEHWAKGISCMSVDSIALAHLMHDMGSQVVGYEEDSTNVHVPMRIAFERGAARQYGGAWINYASGNFGDACNYFTQQPVVPRGAPGWYHSKYAITDGVSITWYRKLYYLNYLSGASAIFWEQGLANQWMLPGPGTHPIQLSPFGRATEDFQQFVDRLPDRGEPYTPVAFLLSYGHSYERVNYSCKMLHTFTEDAHDLELRELFNVAWHPSGVLEGQPQAPDVQSMPGGVYGNIFDVLVDRPERTAAILDYPVLWAAGDVDLTGPWAAALDGYLEQGGTLVLNGQTKTGLATGVRLTGNKTVHETWSPAGGEPRAATPFELAEATLDAGAEVLATADGKPLLVSTPCGQGRIIVTLVPRMLGLDERAHPALPWLMDGVTAGLVPIEVRRADGSPLAGEVMYQVNRTKEGWLVLLINNRGVDKTQSGVARVDRREYVDLAVRTHLPIKSATEQTAFRPLQPETADGLTTLHLRIQPGDVQVLYLVTE